MTTKEKQGAWLSKLFEDDPRSAIKEAMGINFHELEIHGKTSGKERGSLRRLKSQIDQVLTPEEQKMIRDSHGQQEPHEY